jgi:hypothetical protein
MVNAAATAVDCTSATLMVGGASAPQPVERRRISNRGTLYMYFIF